MAFFTNFLSGRAQTETDVELDTNMVQIEEGNNDSALVVYDSGTAAASRNRMYGTPPTPSKRLESPNKFDERTDERGRMAPFTPSKRRYREVGKSISPEKKRALMAANESPNEFDERTDESGRMAPFTPSKRQYHEVDKSISLREKNHALMATNKALVEQHMILAQRAEEASQLAREAEENAQEAKQAQIQYEHELKAMQSAQEKFRLEMMRRYQSDFAKMIVSSVT
jgi:hypothetical protein